MTSQRKTTGVGSIHKSLLFSYGAHSCLNTGPDDRRVLDRRLHVFLRVLRSHADSDVHHYRRVGWREPAYALFKVFLYALTGSLLMLTTLLIRRGPAIDFDHLVLLDGLERIGGKNRVRRVSSRQIFNNYLRLAQRPVSSWPKFARTSSNGMPCSIGTTVQDNGGGWC